MNELQERILLLTLLFFCQSLFAVGQPGQVVFWGGNIGGETMGIAITSDGHGSSPSTIEVAHQTLRDVVSVAGGASHCLALKDDGIVIAWGWNFYGQATVPVGLSNVVAISAGENYSMALRHDGTVVVWGQDGDLIQKNLNGVTNIVAISKGIALKNDGAVTTGLTTPEGLSNIVAIAAPMADHGSLLALKKDGTVVESAFRADAEPVAIGMSNVVAITCGLTLNKNGIVTEWNTRNRSGSEILSNITAIATSGNTFGNYNLALKDDGTVVGWGHGRFYPRTAPAGLSNVVSIAVGGNFCLAITTNSAVADKFRH